MKQMKNTLTTLLLLFVMTVSAQDAKFEKSIMKDLDLMENAGTNEEWQSITNSFERIAAAEPKQWLANYYAGMSNILTGMRQESNDKKDEYYNKALSYVEKADELSADNSEIFVLKSWILGMKISIDPMNRGREMGAEAGTLTSRARELDPSNPRAYYLMGQSAMYTPEQFGGGKKIAMPLLETSLEKFKTFKPSSPIMPRWGERQAQAAMEQCQKM